MLNNSASSHGGWMPAVIVIIDLFGDYGIFYCSFLINIVFNNPANNLHEKPWRLEMKSVILTKQFNFIGKLSFGIKSF